MATETPVASSPPQPEIKTQIQSDGNRGSENLTGTGFVSRRLREAEQAARSAEQVAAAKAVADTPKTPAPEGKAPPVEPKQSAEPPQPKTEPKHEAEEDDVLSQQLDPKIKDKIQKRINKEVGQRKELQDKLAAMEQEIASLRQPVQQQLPPPPTQEDSPLDNINSVQELSNLHENARKALKLAERELEREDMRNIEPDEQAYQIGDEKYSRKQLREVVWRARDTLEQIPTRMNFLQTQAAANQKAVETFPWYKDTNSPEYKQAAMALQSNPWLQKKPDALYLIGVQIEGWKALESRTKQAAKPVEAQKAEADNPLPPRERPRGDQAETSGAGTTERGTPEGVQRANAAASIQALQGKHGISGRDAVALLAQRRLLRQT